VSLLADNMWAFAAVWMALATAAAFLSARIRLAAALVEILLGVFAGFALHLQSAAWIDFVAGFGSIMLTFLAGAEIDPAVLRAQLVPAATLGVASFLAPFLAALAYALFVAHWNSDAAKIAGIAMSTTSVAVVYAVMIESGLATTKLGQLILSACFITDLGTVVALGLLFSNFNGWLALLVAAIAVSIVLVPRLLESVESRLGRRVSEPATRTLFLVVLVLSGIAVAAHSEGVLPAYFLGLACASFLMAHPELSRRLRATTMSLLTPFYFIRAGTLVSIPAAIASWPLIVAFFAVKVGAKIIAVWPLARAFRHPARNAAYITMMMATGLTFGTISSLYGLTHGYIDRAQYTTLVTVVILTAMVPTIVAQALFHPRQAEDDERGVS
jgi:Kef-type K+ transport system membrane component KefB